MVQPKAPPPMPPEETETEAHPQRGIMPLEEMNALQFLRQIQTVFETNLEKDDPWIEVFYLDTFNQAQHMRLWMSPAGHHVSRSEH